MPSTELQQLPIDRIRRSELNPRKGRNASRYEAFKNSIATQGILQPIVVRPVSGDPEHDYEIVAGETRWLASSELGHPFIPALVRTMTDQQARIAAVVENVQRADMTPIEEARSASLLLLQTNNDHEEVMRLLGWSRTKLNARVLLTHASEQVEKALLQGSIKLGHAELLCPLGHADQDMVLAKIIESGMSVGEARDRLLKLTRRLDKATFDTSGCIGCAHNSSAYADLFDASVSTGQCQNLTCWNTKVADHLEQCVTEAKAEFGLVYRCDELPASGYQVIASDGGNGVGQDQAIACRSCASYGAIIDTRNGSEGQVTGRYCFNNDCHNEMKTTYQQIVASATALPASSKAPSTQPGTRSSTSKTTAKAKPNALRPALAKVRHKAYVKLAHRQFVTSLNYVYAQAVSSLCTDLKREVQAGLVDKVLEAAETPPQPSDAKNRAQWVAKLSTLEEGTLLALLTRLSALTLCRTVQNDAFDNNEAAALSALVIDRHQLDPRATFSITPEYLDILTKDELKTECSASGFAGAYDAALGKGAFKKLAAGKVKEMAAAMLNPLEGFTWDGYLPAILTPTHSAKGDTTNNIEAA